MYDRISTNMIYRTAQSGIARNYSSLFQAQARLTSGRSINRPSDDPAATRRVMQLQAERESIARYESNIASARTQLDTAAVTLTGMSNVLTDIRARAVQAANGTNDRAALANIAAEIDELLEGLVASANTKVEDRHLFGGTRTDRLPFELTTGNDGLQRVNYAGNGQAQMVDIGPSLRAQLNLSGPEVFTSGVRGATSVSGTTGAAAGTGSHSLTGRNVLQIRHALTAFGNPSSANGADPVTGLRPAASGAGVDDVLGLGHSVTITTDATGAGTISLNGGADVAFAAGVNDLAVSDASGQTIRVDLSTVQPNLNNVNVDVTGRGTASLDGGATTTSIDFSNANQIVRHGTTGETFFLDATGITAAGDAALATEGTFDLFSTVIAMRDAMTDPNLSVGEIGDTIRARIDDLDGAVEGLTMGLGVLGARQRQLDTMSERLQDIELNVAGLESDLLDVDIVETVSEMQRSQTVYETSLLMASRIRQTSLLNFL